MNLNSSNEGSINSAFQLNEQLANIAIHGEAFEYSDGDDVLYVTQEGIVSEGFCYSDQNTSALDPGGLQENISLPGTWEYVPPDSKSSDSVVCELGPEEVRWFYKSDSDKRWNEFSGYDSFRIEFKYRQLYHDWKYYNTTYSNEQNTEAPMEHCALSSDTIYNNDIYYESNAAGSSLTSESEQHRIVVRGGMYEVDLKTYKCDSIYWPGRGEECVIIRGAWFFDGTWQPLDSECDSTLERVHLELFYGKKYSDYYADLTNKTPKTVLHTQSFPEFHVDWYSPTEVYLYSEAAHSKLVRSVTHRLGFQKTTGYRLCRGYKLPATQTDRPVEITHLVFVIHGIGQKMDTGRIIRNTSTFRDCVTWLKHKYFSSSENRAEFFPVEWRSSLKLDGDIVEAITPHKLQSLRQLLNSSAMDIMYYTSPLYGCEVQRGLSEELNRLYTMFTQRNPYFMSNGGKVSVIAHSLGCVIVYDIVTGWRPDSWQVGASSQSTWSGEDSSLPETPRQALSPDNSCLRFQIENLFCLGSPLSVFLALRLRDPQAPGHVETILPPSLCNNFYNVFHPSDPVAYRMEPLLMREYSRISPVQIQAYNAAIRVDYRDLPPEPLVPEPAGSSTSSPANIASAKRREGLEEMEAESPSNTPSKVDFRSWHTLRTSRLISVQPPSLDPGGWSIWGLMRGSKKSQDGADGSSSPQFDILPIGHHRRLDYVLRETHLGGSYLSALTSHTAYWSNYDVAYFVLTRLFPDLEAQQLQQNPANISQPSLQPMMELPTPGK